MRCKLCKRQSSADGLCKYHSGARTALRNGYVTWSKAYSELSWKDYLNRVKTAEGTGQWVKDVIVLEERGSD